MLPGQVFQSADVYEAKARKAKIALPPNRQAELALHLFWCREDVPKFIPKDMCKVPIDVQANHGRWLVVCECSAAQLASKTDHRFFCLSCLNEIHGAKWRPVRWPKSPQRVEAVLRHRLTVNANWIAGETVKQLEQENKAMGVLNGMDDA